MPVACTLSDFQVQSDAVADTKVLTLRVNAALVSAMTCTLNSTGSPITCSPAGSVAVTAGDLVDIEMDGSLLRNGTNAINIRILDDLQIESPHMITSLQGEFR